MVRLLVDHGAEVDSQDNRKVSCLMASFRKVQTMCITCIHSFIRNYQSELSDCLFNTCGHTWKLPTKVGEHDHGK